MRCLKPTKFSSTGGVFVSCGQCMPCRVRRRQEWLTKLILEWLTWNRGAFITLTYDNDNLPHGDYYKGGTLVKDDVQKFMKRFRFHFKKYDKKREIRYFAVGEYGDNTNRAHYHLLIFNIDIDEAKHFTDLSWKKGFNTVADLHINRLVYTCSYTIKKMTSIHDFLDGRVPEFSLMSRKPAIGYYGLNLLVDLLKDKKMFPKNYAGSYDKWWMEQSGFIQNEWNGTFAWKDGTIILPNNEQGWKYALSQGVRVLRLDTNMSRSLAKLINPTLMEIVDINTEAVASRSAKFNQHMQILKSKISKLSFETEVYYDEHKKKFQRRVSKEYEETKKKSEKLLRQNKQKRTL